MKTKEELKEIKEEILKQVTGGIGIDPGESTDKDLFKEQMFCRPGMTQITYRKPM